MNKGHLEKFMGQKVWRGRLGEWLPLALLVLPITWLFCWGLDQHPLRPGEEVNLVEAARFWLETLQTQGLTPSVLLDNLGRSPLPIWLISFSQAIFGQSINGDRLLGALLNGLSLPLLYCLGKSLYGRSLPALLTVVVYGTSAGVAYWARVVSINSLLLPLIIIFLGSLLFCRRDLRGGLPLGLALAGLSLTDLPTAILLLATGLVFLHWDTPRLQSSPLFWLGLGLGLLPAIAWWSGYGLLPHSTDPLTVIDTIGGSPWPGKLRGWLWILLSSPGLIFAFHTFPQAQQALHWSWARFLICQGGGYTLLMVMAPWPSMYMVMALFAPLALAAGFSLAEVFQGASDWIYPPWWRRFFLVLGGFLALAAVGIYGIHSRSNSSSWTNQHLALTMLTLVLLVLTFTMTSILLDRQRKEFVKVLFWGLFVCLFLAIYTPLINLPPRSLPQVVASTTSQLPAGL